MSGSTRDISMGGMSLQADLAVDQGDVLRVTLHPDLGADLEVQAIVWRHRRVRERRSGDEFTLMGLVLSEAPHDFAERLSLRTEAPSSAKTPSDLEPEPASLSQSGPEPTTRNGALAMPGLPKPTRYRVRVTMRGGPRTRSILVFATSPDEARSTALEETGEGWEVLEAENA